MFGILKSIFALLLIVAIIYAVLKIVTSSASLIIKIVWILAVILFPLIGLIAWYFIGPGR